MNNSKELEVNEELKFVNVWKNVLTIEDYLVDEIVDVGMYESYDDDGKLIDKDDLRIGIKLVTGKVLILDDHYRIVCSNDHIVIEKLVRIKED